MLSLQTEGTANLDNVLPRLSVFITLKRKNYKTNRLMSLGYLCNLECTTKQQGAPYNFALISAAEASLKRKTGVWPPGRSHWCWAHVSDSKNPSSMLLCLHSHRTPLPQRLSSKDSRREEEKESCVKDRHGWITHMVAIYGRVTLTKLRNCHFHAGSACNRHVGSGAGVETPSVLIFWKII